MKSFFFFIKSAINSTGKDIYYIQTDSDEGQDTLKNIREKYNIEYLPSDFKKNNGFLNSVNRSKSYGIYRQNYCGCEFAKSHLKKW